MTSKVYWTNSLHPLLIKNLACADTGWCHWLNTADTNTKTHCTDFNWTETLELWCRVLMWKSFTDDKLTSPLNINADN